MITVTDDGMGFDASAAQKEKDRTGIGLANTKERLATLCGGTMQIESSQKGTIVTIRLPKGI